MRIKNITIKNFKGIEHKTLEFDPNFTVLIGDNGSGKSSILDAISVALGTILMRTQASFGINGRKTRPLLRNEIRKLMVSPDNIELTDVELSGEFKYKETILNWERKQNRNSKSLTYGEAKNLINIGTELVKMVDKPVNFPVMVYHSTARLASEIHGKRPSFEKIGSRFDGYYACLDPRSIKQKFMSWFKTFEDSALKFNKDKTLYIAFTSALTSLIPEWSEIRFHWGLDDMVGRIDENNWLPLSHLSDGYRSTIRLAADIAYRAIKLNPHLGTDAVTKAEGIVLIDELDMHLHPKWQKVIVPNLKRTFPNLQFIITTHSPFIVQSLKANEILNLENNEIDQHPDSMSIEQNALFMGVESRNSSSFSKKEKIAINYLKILESDSSEDELIKLQELIDSTSDPVFKAKLMMEKLSKYGK